MGETPTNDEEEEEDSDRPQIDEEEATERDTFTEADEIWKIWSSDLRCQFF